MKIQTILLSLSMLLLVSMTTNASILVNPGFETVEPIGTFWPNQYGDWNGDGGTVVGTENGITPFEGTGMLRFDYSAPQSYGATNLAGSQIEQLVDASLFGDVSSGNVTINASVRFNRVAGDSQTDTLFALILGARLGSPANYPSDKETTNGYLVGDFNEVYSDDNAATWEQVSVSLTLPSNTSYVSIQLMAIENVFNDYSGVEFDGHYADDVLLSANSPVPEPTAISIWLVLGMGVVASWRSRRQR